jgi:hypothetical protein
MLKRSNSLLVYYKRQKEIFQLLRIAREKQQSLKTAQQAIPVIRSGTVLLYGHLEGYIEDVTSEAIRFLNNSSINSCKLPIRLKMANCHADLSEFFQTTNITKKEAILSGVILNNYPLWSGEVLPPARIEEDCITKNFANPSCEHIVKIFKYFDVEKPFSTFYQLGFNARRVGQITPTLESLATLRHDIAHGSFSAACTYTDLVGYIRTTNILCRCIDARIGIATKDITDIFPWIN